MEIRHSALRSTISGTRPAIEEDEEAEDQRPKNSVRFLLGMKKRRSAGRQTVDSRPAPEDEPMVNAVRHNTDQQMYAKNSLYEKLCVLCNKKQRDLVPHYVKEHPDSEVLIARLSPGKAIDLRTQSAQFEKAGKKIKGPCFFCEENKSMGKTDWERHLLTHTGESLFNCTVCRTGMKSAREHDKKCDGQAVRIYHENASDGSVFGFMCYDCNYLQIGRERMVKHLIKEHGFNEPTEAVHYRQLKLILQ